MLLPLCIGVNFTGVRGDAVLVLVSGVGEQAMGGSVQILEQIACSPISSPDTEIPEPDA
jgi:hypothetical protein